MCLCWHQGTCEGVKEDLVVECIANIHCRKFERNLWANHLLFSSSISQRLITNPANRT